MVSTFQFFLIYVTKLHVPSELECRDMRGIWENLQLSMEFYTPELIPRQKLFIFVDSNSFIVSIQF